MSDPKKKGSVLIVGGGIGGMQAALDLAEGGFKVHLAQKDPSIGGIMSMLDKTFPTGDCAMCMISPKMVEVGRHPNIHIMTMSELAELKGEPGNFRARVTHKARSIDASKCTGCGECTRACPVRNIIQLPERAPLPELPATWAAALDRAVEAHAADPHALIAMLHHLNHELQYLPRAVLAHLARRLEVPESQVLSTATFYNSFTMEPVGRHVIEVCKGGACHVDGGHRLLDRLREELQVEDGQTTADERFTLRTVPCIGCCALAPAIKIDGQAFGFLKVSQLPKVLKDFA